MQQTQQPQQYMQLALDLAKQGIGKVNPNPLVGAVLVKEGRIIGSGYHAKYGEAHAEVNAIKSAVEEVSGATIYVTLEPCSHYGKTPPCAELLIKQNIKRVVVGMLDPNPLVAGRGIRMLEEAGIEVAVGVLEEECKKLNEPFVHFITTKTPYVLLKVGMSLDGKIATSTGESKWITGEAARREVHELRNEYMGIMVGIQTILADDAELTCRIPKGRNPIRIIVDSNLRIPLESKVLTGLDTIKTIIATTNTTSDSKQQKIQQLEELGAIIIQTNPDNGRVNLTQLMSELGKQSIDSILLEGGATLNDAALKGNIIQKVRMYIAPKLIGGREAKTPIGGSGITQLSDAIQLQEIQLATIGEDIVIEGKVKATCLQEL